MPVEQQIALVEQLKEFASMHPEVECCAIISTTGIMLAGYNINWENEDKFAAICTANFGLLSRSSRELAGKMRHFTVQIEGRDGTTILCGDGRQIIFIALCKSGARERESLLRGIHRLIDESSY
jgi:predicted regulator of Ras-like GTPase activity (Roadblock/LC7/MglB family)